MNCIEFRRLRLSDPYVADKHLTSHKKSCQSCSDFERDILLLDEKVKHALMVDVPEGLSARILLNQSLGRVNRRPPLWRWTSLAASVVIVIMLSMYQFPEPDSLQTQLVSHLKQEHIVLPAGIGNVDDAIVQKVLNSISLHADGSIGKVTFAENCDLDGEMVGHLVVEWDNVNYNLLIVPGNFGRDAQEFIEDNWHGIVTSHSSGNRVALLSKVASLGSKDRDAATMRTILAELDHSITPLNV